MKRKDYLEISKKTKLEVWARDGGKCVVCGNHCAMPNSHVVRRSRGGLGIKENVVTHCLKCHMAYDSFDPEIVLKTEKYVRELYPDWTKEKVTYKKNEKNTY